MTVASDLTLKYSISNNGGVQYSIPMRIQSKDDIEINTIQTGITATLDPAKYSVSNITESSFQLNVVQTGDIPLAPDSAEVRLIWPLQRTENYQSGTISSVEFNANGDSEVIGTMARIQDATQYSLRVDAYDSQWIQLERFPTADYDSGKDLAITMKWGDQPKWTELITNADLVALQAEVDANKAILESYTFPSSNNLFQLPAGVHSDAPMTAMGLLSGLDAAYYTGPGGNSGASFISYVVQASGTFVSVQQAIHESVELIGQNSTNITANLTTLNSYSFPTANNLFGVATGAHPELPMKAMGLLSGQDAPFYLNELHDSGASYVSTVDTTVSPPTFSNVQADLTALYDEIATLKSRLDALEE